MIKAIQPQSSFIIRIEHVWYIFFFYHFIRPLKLFLVVQQCSNVYQYKFKGKYENLFSRNKPILVLKLMQRPLDLVMRPSAVSGSHKQWPSCCQRTLPLRENIEQHQASFAVSQSWKSNRHYDNKRRRKKITLIMISASHTLVCGSDPPSLKVGGVHSSIFS